MRKVGANCMKTNKCIIVYSILVILLSLCIDYWVVDMWGYTSQKANIIFMLCMWIPTLVVIVTKLLCKETIYLGLKNDIHIFTANKNVKKYIGIAILVPLFMATVGNAIMMIMYHNIFEYKDIDKKLLIAVILQAVSSGVVYSFALSLGQEIGFRGYLMPLLEKKYGVIVSVIAGGIIYGACSGVKLYNGYLFGKDYKGQPYVGIFLYVVFAIFLSIVLYWLYQKSGNILVPALYQGGVYIATNGLCNLMATKEISALITGVVYMGLVSVVPGGVIIVGYMRRRKIERLN